MSEDFSQKQQMALAELKRGSSFKAAAQAAGVNRITLYRWVKSDPDFRAAYNAWEQERLESARARLVRASGRAVDRVVRSIDVDPKFAFNVLKALGVFSPKSAGPINLEHVRQQIELEMKAQEPPNTETVRRLAVTVSQPSELPQTKVVSSLVVGPHQDMQPDEAKEPPRQDELKNAPLQSAAAPPQVLVSSRSPDQIPLGEILEQEAFVSDQQASDKAGDVAR